MSTKAFRIGCGAGFSSDRLDPAVDLVKHARLDVIIFECIGERTLAFGHRDKQLDPTGGYNPYLERRMRAILPDCVKNSTRIVTNMGVANPLGAAEKVVQIAREQGLTGLRVAAVQGDDVGHLIGPGTRLLEGMTVADTGRELISANAYLGADAILPALEADADVVITGRVADPSLVLAPLRHHYGWAEDDWARLGAGTVVGHLLECAGQITGGYFADPGYKDVPNLAYIGFPYAEVGPDGSATITKLEDSGGVVDQRTVKEQLLYEVHDPSAYLTPDVTANFSTVQVNEQRANRVAVSGANGSTRPQRLKTTVAFDGGLLAEAGVSYAGPGAQQRARLAGDIVQERLRALHGSNGPLRIDLIGVDSLHSSAVTYVTDSQDIRLRCALRASSREEAELLLWEVEALLCCGPYGGGGYRGHITPSVITYSTFVERDQVHPSFELMCV